MLYDYMDRTANIHKIYYLKYIDTAALQHDCLHYYTASIYLQYYIVTYFTLVLYTLLWYCI